MPALETYEKLHGGAGVPLSRSVSGKICKRGDEVAVEQARRFGLSLPQVSRYPARDGDSSRTAIGSHG